MVKIIHIEQILVVFLFTFLFAGCGKSAPTFDAGTAWDFLEYQVALGPRPVGSAAHGQTIEWIVDNLVEFGWSTEIQESSRLGHPIRNIVAKRGDGEPWMILGAHYDTRLISDKDSNPDRRTSPVMGANDGASGVAVLLELARTLPKDLDMQIWLVFFDAEDNGNISGWDWILGSTSSRISASVERSRRHSHRGCSRAEL